MKNQQKFKFSSDIDTHCWIVLGMFPDFRKFFGVTRGKPFSCLFLGSWLCHCFMQLMILADKQIVSYNHIRTLNVLILSIRFVLQFWLLSRQYSAVQNKLRGMK